MKKNHLSIIICTCLMLCVQALAAGLLPASDPVCELSRQSGSIIDCDEGSGFVVGDGGRCGCLSPNEYFDVETCRRVSIRCDENAPFSTIYTSLGVHLGCGCFQTIGMHR